MECTPDEHQPNPITWLFCETPGKTALFHSPAISILAENLPAVSSAVHESSPLVNDTLPASPTAAYSVAEAQSAVISSVL